LVLLDRFFPDDLERDSLMRGRKRLLILSVLGVCAAAASTAGALSTIGGSDPGSPGFTPIQHAQAVGPNAAHAGINASTLDGALQQLKARLGDDRIAVADVRLVPTTASNAGGEVAFLTVDASGPGAPGIRANWEGELVAGALRDVAAENGLGTLDNFQISTRLPDGTATPTNGGFGNVVRSQLFDASPPTVIDSRIRAGLADAGLKPISINFVSALQASPVVVAEAADPAAVVAASEDARWWTKILGGDFQNYEGYYLELRDSSGDPFLISTAANRAGSSSGWIRPDLNPRPRVNAVPTGNAGG
jgi:hypothetical protein